LPATPDGFADSGLAGAKLLCGFFLAMLTNEFRQPNWCHGLTRKRLMARKITAGSKKVHTCGF